MEQGPLGLNPELRTRALPAAQVRAGTGHRVLARNYTTDQGRPSYLRVHSLRATSCRNFLDTSNPAQRSCRRSTTGSLPSSIWIEGPAREGTVKDERKSLRHVLYGNNPRSLTRRLQAKLVHERTASRSDRHAPKRARTPFSTPHGGPGRGPEN